MSQDDVHRYGPPPGYGPPGYGPFPGYGWRRPTNQLAVLALLLAFVLGPVGLVLGLVARRQVQQTGEAGDGLALAAVVIGGIATTLIVVGVVLSVALLAALSSGSSAP